MKSYQTLIEMLEAAALEGQNGYIFLSEGEEQTVPFSEARTRAIQAAKVFQREGVEKGDRVLLVIPTGVDFASSFFGLLLCGAIPCVLAPPNGAGSLTEGIERVRRIGAQLGARRLVTTAKDVSAWAGEAMPFRVHSVEQLRESPACVWQPVQVTSADLAFIQVSSGSTGTPKCVKLTHGNVLANLDQIGRRLQFKDDVVVCWLPLFHDMGLVGCFLMVAYWQLSGVFLSPIQFLRRPVQWLKAISRYRGTVSPAPNFAYALATERVKDSDLAGLDLSSWQKALCGAEPIEAGTLQKFAERFRPCGLAQHALVPCYGLAEATLAVSMHQFGEPWRFECVSRSALANQGIALVASVHPDDAIRTTDCGAPMDGTEIRIADETGAALPEGHVGRVWVSGPSVMEGYEALPEQTAQTLQGRWLDTGDLGYLRHGHLFVTGRRKDLVIIRGEKYLPSDFEQSAADVPGISKGRVVAFGVSDAKTGTEGLYVVCEQPRAQEMDVDQLRETVRSHLATVTGVFPAHVGFVPHNAIPRTTSGKLQRSKAKAMYLAFMSSEVDRSGVSRSVLES